MQRVYRDTILSLDQISYRLYRCDFQRHNLLALRRISVLLILANIPGLVSRLEPRVCEYSIWFQRLVNVSVHFIRELILPREVLS